MAMDSTVLAAALKAKVLAKNPAFEEVGNDMDWLFEAVAEGVVEHIQTFATVGTTVAVASVSAVTPGPSASGPGTGTGTGTIT
jgi:hypothetical protein